MLDSCRQDGTYKTLRQFNDVPWLYQVFSGREQTKKKKNTIHIRISILISYTSKSIKNVMDADGNENMEPNCEGGAAPR